MLHASSLPAGFRAAGIHCGIKSDPQNPDLTLFVSDRPASAAGVFTQNRVCGAPVVVSRQRVPSETARAVLINSGNANACTGQQGIDDALASTSAVASLIGCRPEDVLVCSTGVIGHLLPMEKLAAGIPQAFERLDATPDAFSAAARSMMTTDTIPKQAHRRINVDGTPISMTAAAKGAAMIAPNMATMLAVVLTDAALTPQQADELLRSAVDRSFNRISVDGHTSTSDTVLLLANGAAGDVATTPDAIAAIGAAVTEVCEELAEAIIRDAEGATHFIVVDVRGLESETDALRIARSVADSPLVKTAMAGGDPNWGRIVSAAGYAGVPFDERELSLTINGTLVYRGGVPVPYDESAASRSIRDSYDTSLVLTFQQGDGAGRILTSDLTADYVRLNADYTT